MALFMSPEDVRIAQQQANASLTPFAAENQIRGSLFNLGGGFGRGLITATGGDPRSPVEKRAGVLQQAMKGMDFNDPASITATMNQLNDAGFQAEALKLLEALPTPAKPQKTVVDEWVQNEQVGDTTKRFLFQRDNFGFITRVGEVSDTATNPLKGFALGNEWQRDVQFDDDSRNTFLARMANRDEFGGFGPLPDSDEEELSAFTGLIAKVANDLKDSHRSSINEALMNGQITRFQAESAVAPNDDFYLDTAYQRFVEAGGVEANIDRGLGMAGADVAINPNLNTTDPNSLDAAIERNDRKAKAVADVAAKSGKLVVGDPRTNAFRMGGMAPEQAAVVFGDMTNKSDEQIAAELGDMGYVFNDELMQSHAIRWQFMREEPFVTAKFINLADNQDLFDAERAILLRDLEENGNFQSFAKAAEILKYIDRLGPGKRTKGINDQLRQLEAEAGGA